MALNDYQLISRFLPGRPFGDGRDGALTSTTIPAPTTLGCAGSSGSPTLTISSAGFSNGDFVLIHQTRGSGAGAWEINKVASGGGTTTLTLDKNLSSTYNDTGANQAQIIKLALYSSVNIASGTWTLPAWDGSLGGIFAFACNGQVSFANTVTATGKGFRNGTGGICFGSGTQAEGSAGAAGGVSTSANGSGGGGGQLGSGESPNGLFEGSGGGGGGNVNSGNGGGSTDTAAPDTSYGGNGGSAISASDLVTASLGGGGGGGGSLSQAAHNRGYHGNGADGGIGGGLLFMFCKTITVTGAVAANGNVGGAGSQVGGGGGGAGGSILIACQSATLGTGLVTAAHGDGGAAGYGNSGGQGSDGAIAIHYSGDISGTTTPTFTQVNDGRLVEMLAGLMFFI